MQPTAPKRERAAADARWLGVNGTVEQVCWYMAARVHVLEVVAHVDVVEHAWIVVLISANDEWVPVKGVLKPERVKRSRAAVNLAGSIADLFHERAMSVMVGLLDDLTTLIPDLLPRLSERFGTQMQEADAQHRDGADGAELTLACRGSSQTLG